MSYTLVPIPPSSGGKGSRPAQEDIPLDVGVAVEEAFKYCADTDERLQAEMTREEGDEFLRYARAYAYYRDPRVVVVGNSFKGGVRFRVEVYVTDAADA
jgi:hypothetical protein